YRGRPLVLHSSGALGDFCALVLYRCSAGLMIQTAVIRSTASRRSVVPFVLLSPAPKTRPTRQAQASRDTLTGYRCDADRPLGPLGRGQRVQRRTRFPADVGLKQRCSMLRREFSCRDGTALTGG